MNNKFLSQWTCKYECMKGYELWRNIWSRKQPRNIIHSTFYLKYSNVGTFIHDIVIIRYITGEM